MTTLRDLTASGDAIARIEGVLSGTLSYLFNVFDGSAPFSAVVRTAHGAGYTEPDPREDLAGRDVARKLLILSRQLGLQMDLEEVSVDSLVPPRLADGPFAPQFFSDLTAHDDEMQQRLEHARARGNVLRYVGTIEAGRAHAELRGVPLAHPFAAHKRVRQHRCRQLEPVPGTPLILQGPGAGVEVTAMGIFSDILKLLHFGQTKMLSPRELLIADRKTSDPSAAPSRSTTRTPSSSSADAARWCRTSTAASTSTGCPASGT